MEESSAATVDRVLKWLALLIQQRSEAVARDYEARFDEDAWEDMTPSEYEVADSMEGSIEGLGVARRIVEAGLGVHGTDCTSPRRCTCGARSLRRRVLKMIRVPGVADS